MTVEVDITPTKAELAEARMKVNIHEEEIQELIEEGNKRKDVKTQNQAEYNALIGATFQLVQQLLSKREKYEDAMKEYIELLEERNLKLENLIPDGTLEER